MNRILIFDIETTNLGADFGFMLCFGYKWLGEPKTHIISITESPTFAKDKTDDSYVVKKAAEILKQADVWVAHYGSRFDVPYLQSRLILHNQPVLPPTPLVDTWRISKYKLHLHSNRLASISAFLGLEDKTALKGPAWVKAMSGDKKSISYIEQHCRQDVIVLEQAYERIKALTTDHPMVGDKGKCAVCGSEKLQGRGYQVTHTNRYQRLQCQSCGTWRKGKVVKEV